MPSRIPAARIRATAVLASASLALVALLAGCGTGRPSPRPTVASSGHHRGRAPSSPTAIPLSLRLVDPTWFPGYYGTLMPTVIYRPETLEADVGLVGAQLHGTAMALRRLGFLGAVRQTLFGPGRSSVEVVSVAERFRSPAGARGELRRARSQPRGPGAEPALPVQRFPVSAIPGAIGTETVGPFASSRAIAFAAGSFFYQVAAITPHADGHGPSRHQLSAASVALWQRVRNAFAT